MAVGLSGERLDAPHDAIASGDRATNDEDRIIAADSPEYIGPGFPVEGGGDRLSASGNGAEDEHFTGAVNAEKKLRQKRLEGGATFLNAAVGNGVSCAFGGGDACQPKLA